MQYKAKSDGSLIKRCFALNIVVLLFLELLGLSTQESIAYPVLLIIDSMIMAYVYRDNRGLFLMSLFILYTHYSIAIGIYSGWVERPLLYDQLSNERAYDEGMLSMIIFTCIVMLPGLSKTPIVEQQNHVLTKDVNYSSFIEIACFIAFIVVFITQNEWRQNARMQGTPLGEYKYIFAILGGVYSQKKNISRILWILLLSLVVLITIVGGNRAEVFSLIFVILIVWIPDISLKKLLPICIPVFIFSRLVGQIRGNLAMLSNYTVGGFIASAFRDYWVQDTFTFAYFPSIALIDVSEFQDISTKISTFTDSVLYVFFGGEYGYRLLIWHVTNFYTGCGGSIGAVSLNYWLGIYGSIIAGFVVAYIISKIRYVNASNKKRSLSVVLYMCFICMVSRWYVYNFMSLFRSFLVITIMYVVIDWLNNFLFAKRFR